MLENSDRLNVKFDSSMPVTFMPMNNFCLNCNFEKDRM